jgi:hypothetical protein
MVHAVCQLFAVITVAADSKHTTAAGDDKVTHYSAQGNSFLFLPLLWHVQQTTLATAGAVMATVLLIRMRLSRASRGRGKAARASAMICILMHYCCWHRIRCCPASDRRCVALLRLCTAAHRLTDWYLM